MWSVKSQSSSTNSRFTYRAKSSSQSETFIHLKPAGFCNAYNIEHCYSNYFSPGSVLATLEGIGQFLHSYGLRGILRLQKLVLTVRVRKKELKKNFLSLFPFVSVSVY